MPLSEKGAGIAVAKVERFQQQWLPRLLDIKAAVERGERLTDTDLGFLREVLQDANYDQRFLAAHPEWQDLSAQAIRLYNDITTKALENEHHAGP